VLGSVAFSLKLSFADTVRSCRTSLSLFSGSFFTFAQRLFALVFFSKPLASALVSKPTSHLPYTPVHYSIVRNPKQKLPLRAADIEVVSQGKGGPAQSFFELSTTMKA